MQQAEKIAELTKKYEVLSQDPDLEKICLWVQPNSDDPFDESTLLEGNDLLLKEFFELDAKSLTSAPPCT